MADNTSRWASLALTPRIASAWSLWQAITTWSKRLAAAGVGHVQAAADAADGADRAGQADVVELRGDLLHVLAAAALHASAIRPVEDLQQAVVRAEADEGGERRVEHLAGRAGPDRRRHRQQVPVGEGVGVAAFAQEVAQRALVVRMRGQPRDAFAVEAQDVGKHAPELPGARGCASGRRRVARLLPAHSRSGFSRLTAKDISVSTDSTPSSANMRDQVRIGALVEDQEAGIDRMGPAVQRDVDRIGVAAEVAAGLEQRDVMVAARAARRWRGRRCRHRRRRCVVCRSSLPPQALLPDI